MEYCITVLIETFEPGMSFRKPEPRQTVWGPATRSGDEGKLIWSSQFFVRRRPLDTNWLRRLAPQMQSIAWVALDIGGPGTFDLANYSDPENEDNVNVSSAEDELVLLLTELLKDQSQWIVFVLKHCDELVHIYHQTYDELCQSVLSLRVPESEASDGFCSVYNKA